jgi:hypothetical protein
LVVDMALLQQRVSLVVAAVQEAAAHTRLRLGLELRVRETQVAPEAHQRPIMAAARAAAQVQLVQMARHP